MNCWRDVVAERVRQDFLEGIKREPLTIWKLRRLARRYGGELHFSRKRVKTENREGFIIIRWSRNPRVSLRRALHELSESALRWEGIEPYVYPPNPGEHHRVSRIVECLPLEQ